MAVFTTEPEGEAWLRHGDITPSGYTADLDRSAYFVELDLQVLKREGGVTTRARSAQTARNLENLLDFVGGRERYEALLAKYNPQVTGIKATSREEAANFGAGNFMGTDQSGGLEAPKPAVTRGVGGLAIVGGLILVGVLLLK